MTHFSEDFNRFFKELAANNHKEWFDANRTRYVKEVKEPFEKFIADLMKVLAKTEPELVGDPKKTIFRINRDIRFAKDKSPYKLNRAAHLSAGGKKDGATPGLYLQMGPEMVMVGGGAYQPDKMQLEAIREKIVSEPDRFREAIEDPNFVETFGEVLGEENKRLPNGELAEAAEKQPLIYKKQFYYMAEFPAEIVTDELLVDFIAEKHNDASKLRNFLKEALA